MSPRRILVTGGAGFIGSNIVAELADDPAFEVVVCDRLRDAGIGKWRNISKHFIHDFVQPEGLVAWLEANGDDLDVIVHMGAISSTTEPDADKIVDTNFSLSRRLFDWCARHGRRFIWASSAATYGDGEAGFADDQSFEALRRLRPLNAYGWSKAAFDLFAIREAEADRAPAQWAGLKFFNVYGPNEGHKGAMRSVAAKIWPDVAAGRPVSLFRSHREGVADGGQKRDFVYVRDAAAVVAWLVRHSDISGLYNLGSGKARSFRELAEAVFRAAAREPEIHYIDMPEALRAQYQYFTEAPMGRLAAAGYKSEFASLETGVTEYVQRYLATEDPYR